MSDEKKVDGRRASALKNLEAARQKKNELIKKGKEKETEKNSYQLEILEQSDSENSDSESEEEVMIIKPKSKQKPKQKEIEESPKDDMKEQLELLKKKLAQLEKAKTPKKPQKKSGTILNVSLPSQTQPPKEESKQSQMLRNKLINF